MDQVVTFDDKMQTEAKFLADDFGLALSGHKPDDYDELLRTVAQTHHDCKSNNWFRSVSEKLLKQHHNCKQDDMQQIVACTALLAIHHWQFRVYDVEEICEISGGTLAKIKGGKVNPNHKLTPWQLILLAAELKLTLAELFTDFSDRPNALQEIFANQVEASTEPPPEQTAEETAMPPPEPAPITATPPAKAAEPVINEPETAATAARSPIRPPDHLLVTHIRAALKRSEMNVTQLMQGIGIDNRAYLTKMERGKATLDDEQLTEIATTLNLSLDVLYSGEGLRVQPAASNALAVVGSKTLTLPPLSTERRQEFYRDLCLRRGVIIADGEDVGELLEAARSGDDIDWYDLWLRVTEQGVRFKTTVDKTAKATRGMGEIAKADFLTELYQQLFTRTNESE